MRDSLARINVDKYPSLLEHFQVMRGEPVAADVFKSAYDACERVLSNPEKFPKAAFDKLEIVVNDLFDCSATACTLPPEMLAAEE